MARIKGIDIPNEKRIEIALTYIYGIGRNLSKQILTAANVDLNKKAKDLTEDEEAIFKRGRNAHSGHVPKNQSDADYRYATGLETLYGYLYLIGDFERITYIFNISTGEEYLENFRNKENN